MSVSPLASLQTLIDNEVNEKTELRVKETMAELLGGIAREFGLAVVPMRPEITVPVKAHRPVLTAKTEAVIDWTEFDRSVKSYFKLVSRGNHITAAQKRSISRLIKAGEALRSEFGTTQRMLSERAGRSESWYGQLIHTHAKPKRVDKLRIVR